MPQKIVVYWRDIPSQIIIKRGRNKGKWVLSDRFQKAIDRAAMKAGKAGTDDYVAEWRRVTTECENSDDIQAQAEQEANQYEADYSDTRLKDLVKQGGLEQADA
ncbi:MAG: hypothetical protein CSB47_11230 [Proteobacteria bacterium]|nr:MAG: hypothetical protein CSB47_11230 [Pseudomonadota bacterium]